MIKRASITAILVLGVVILSVEAYFVYQFYTKPSVSTGEAGETTVEPSKKTDANKAVFVHRSTPENIVDNSTYIDHPSTNENPEAVLLVTQIWSSDGEATNTHPIGVWYDANRGGRWAIFNQDLAPMPEGVTFNVVVPESGAEAAVHQASPENTVDNATYLDHPLANDNPDAILSVTPNWNPGELGGVYDDHFIGIRYDEGEGRWAILNQDLAQMPQSAAFNVFFLDSPSSTS